MPPRLEDPNSLNRYAYASGNPMKYIDPSGAVDEVSAVASDIANSGALGTDSLIMLITMFKHAFGLDEAEEREERAARYNQQMAFQMQQRATIPLPAPPALDIPMPLAGAGTSGCGAFFPGPPGAPVADIFPGAGPFGINAGNGDDNFLGGPGGGLMPPGDFFGGSSGLLGSPGDDTLLDPGGAGGGIFNSPNAISVANSTLAENTAEGVSAQGGAAAAAAQQSVIQFFTATYIVLQTAAQKIFDETLKNGGRTDKASRDRFSAIDKQRALIGEIIQSLGGTVPPPQ
jgi:hypothetical protein